MFRSSSWPPSLKFPHQNPVYTSSLPIHATCPIQLILLDLITWILFGEQYKSWSSSLCSFLHCLVISSSFGPTMFQHPVLENLQSLLVLPCVRASFTTIWNNRQNYSCVYFNLYTFGWQTGREKILDQRVAGIPCPCLTAICHAYLGDMFWHTKTSS
jgi:hypothetical protein